MTKISAMTILALTGVLGLFACSNSDPPADHGIRVVRRYRWFAEGRFWTTTR